MFRRVEDFTAGWEVERNGTLALLRTLTDGSLAQEVAPGSRTLGRIAWHTVVSVGEMARHAGLPIDAPADDAPMPAAARDFVEIYERVSARLPEAVAASWTDDDLLGTIDMYGDRWTRGKTLAVLVAHQTHHRGQMTVLMRQAGLLVPGIYGPSKEEWARYGMAAQD
jgi:uncharacterized damage-inducible protein DinB